MDGYESRFLDVVTSWTLSHSMTNNDKPKEEVNECIEKRFGGGHKDTKAVKQKDRAISKKSRHARKSESCEETEGEKSSKSEDEKKGCHQKEDYYKKEGP